MCYHWGLGVGHLHAHCVVSTSNGRSGVPDEPRDIEDDQNGDCEPDNVSEDTSNIDCASLDACDSNKSEWDLDNRDLEGWGLVIMTSLVETNMTLSWRTQMKIFGCNCSSFAIWLRLLEQRQP